MNVPSVPRFPQEAVSDCTSNGGYYVPGTTKSSWITVDSEDGAIGAYSSDNGILEFTASTNNAYGVDITTVGVNVPTTNVESNVYTSSPGELSPSAQRTIRAIAKAAPTVCGGGAFVYGGFHGEKGQFEGAGLGLLEYDSQTGIRTGSLVEGAVGPVGLGRIDYTGGGGTEYLVLVGSPVAGTLASKSSLGVYGGSPFLGGGAYVNITTNAGCNHK